MLIKNDITELLGLEDVSVKQVKNTESGLHIWLELPLKAHQCPNCGETTTQVHDYREQKIKDIPLGRATYLHLRKRRYRCPVCGKRFAEENTFLPRYYRSTSRLIAQIIDAYRRTVSSTDIAARYHVSLSTALRYFDRVSHKCHELPEVLAIDEFKGNAGGQKYQSILTDVEHHRVLDILPSRYEPDLLNYFKQFSNRNEVKYFVSDMNPHFRAVAKVCFPNAKCVADRYHVTRQACWAMENVRKNEQKRLSKRFRLYFKHSKRLLFKPLYKLTEDEMDRLALMFEISPRLAAAYRLKNEFVRVMHSPNSKTGKSLLLSWMKTASDAALPEFEACLKACRNWFQEILNAMDCPWSNGFTEGYNNKIKVLKRVCYGVRNFERFRNRILFCGS